MRARSVVVLSRRADAGAAFRAGIFAGLAGTLLLDAYRLGIAYISRGTLPEDHYRYVASALIGSGAHALPGAAWLGVAVHVALSLAWGVGFAMAARGSAEILRRPILSGTLFGCIVYLLMRLCVLAAGIARAVTPSATFVEIVAHTVFFGVPIALIVSTRLRHA